jgi:DNA-binding response OmpR family regulator
VTNTAAARILVVDDDEDLRALLQILLERAGYDVTVAADGREGLRQAYALRPDLIVLDLAMPHLSGWDALDRIRDLSEVPVLLLTAAVGEAEKVRGLRAGADDYVTKPFGRQELLARIEVLLRRSRRREEDAPEVIDDGFARVDITNRRVEVRGEEVALTPLEYKLMAAFVRHPQQVLSRDQLLDLVWNDTLHTSGDQVKLYVGYLRRKLDAVTDDAPIETIRGFGYRYRPRAVLRESA